jgi:hypothetical protein
MTSIMVIEVSCLFGGGLDLKFGGGLDLKWVIIPVFIGLIYRNQLPVSCVDGYPGKSPRGV